VLSPVTVPGSSDVYNILLTAQDIVYSFLVRMKTLANSVAASSTNSVVHSSSGSSGEEEDVSFSKLATTKWKDGCLVSLNNLLLSAGYENADSSLAAIS